MIYTVFICSGVRSEMEFVFQYDNANLSFGDGCISAYGNIVGAIPFCNKLLQRCILREG